GYRVVYCPQSVVMHSHNYTPDQAYKRSFGEAKVLAAVWTGRRTDVNWLAALADRLTGTVRVHVEFKIDSLAHFGSRPVSLFSYDLVSRSRTLYGLKSAFAGCEHHLQAGNIPVPEATRLLLNRCSGLLLAKAILSDSESCTEEALVTGKARTRR